METISQDNKRIAKNTLMLYLRMLFSMLVSLYTSRVVLSTLGVEDYGIYNVVGGIVAMFGMFNSAMSSATSRYITFELGRGNLPQLQRVFVTAIHIHALISLLGVVLAETVGLWFFYTQMVIPAERVDAAFWVYQLSILTMVLMVVSVPYNATIIAHERMEAFAFISILETVLRLVIVYLLVLTPYDKLVFYATLLFLVQVLIRFIYGRYCARHFEETHYRFIHDRQLTRSMFAFAGWNLWGNTAGLFANTGVNLLLNMFFGPAVNAARGLSAQAMAAISSFCGNFQQALNPQITKTYARGELEAMHKLIFRSGRFSFGLLFALSLPVLLLTEGVLGLWLVEVPEHAANFLRLTIVISLCDVTAGPLMVAAQATGRVKKYQSVVGGIILLIAPLAYLTLKLGCAPEMVYAAHLFIAIIAYVARLYMLRPLIRLSMRHFAREVGGSMLRIVVVGTPIPFLLRWLLLPGNDLASLGAVGVVSVASVCLATYFFGLDRAEKQFVDGRIQLLRARFTGKHGAK